MRKLFLIIFSSGGLNKSKTERLEQLKKRPTKRPDWNELMQVLLLNHFYIFSRNNKNKFSKQKKSLTRQGLQYSLIKEIQK